MKKVIFLPAILVLLMACNTATTNNAADNTRQELSSLDASAAQQFWNALQALQGKSFEGQLLNAPANDDFAGKQLVMHVLHSDDETILIPFNVGDNRSRTWIFKFKDGRIELKHDHRHEDGTHDEVTMYGGTSTNDGKSHMQVFPADQQTLEMLPDAFSNVWWVTVDNTTYTYNLRRIGTERVFTVVFDLTNEIETPERSWGWEDYL